MNYEKTLDIIRNFKETKKWHHFTEKVFCFYFPFLQLLHNENNARADKTVVPRISAKRRGKPVSKLIPKSKEENLKTK